MLGPGLVDGGVDERSQLPVLRTTTASSRLELVVASIHVS